MLVSDRKRGDDFDRAGQSLNDGSAQFVGGAGQQCVGARRQLHQFLAAIEVIAQIEARLVIPPEAFMDRFWEFARDEDDGFSGHFVRLCWVEDCGKKGQKAAATILSAVSWT